MAPLDSTSSAWWGGLPQAGHRLAFGFLKQLVKKPSVPGDGVGTGNASMNGFTQQSLLDTPLHRPNCTYTWSTRNGNLLFLLVLKHRAAF
jgi:hypothetical protein